MITTSVIVASANSRTVEEHRVTPMPHDAIPTPGRPRCGDLVEHLRRGGLLAEPDHLVRAVVVARSGDDQAQVVGQAAQALARVRRRGRGGRPRRPPRPDAGQLLDHVGGDRRAAVVRRTRARARSPRPPGRSSRSTSSIGRARARHVVPPAVVEEPRERLVDRRHDAGAHQRHRQVRPAGGRVLRHARRAASSASTGSPSAAIRSAILASRLPPLGPGPGVLARRRRRRPGRTGRPAGARCSARRGRPGSRRTARRRGPGAARAAARRAPRAQPAVVSWSVIASASSPAAAAFATSSAGRVGAVRRRRVGVQIDPHVPY